MTIKVVPYAGNAAHQDGDLVRFNSGRIYQVVDGRGGKGVVFIAYGMAELVEVDSHVSFSQTPEQAQAQAQRAEKKEVLPARCLRPQRWRGL